MTGTIPVRRFATIDSTNLEAQRLASVGTRGPLWVLSDEQTGGRGRLGRNWVSAPGNLYASLLLPIAASAAAVPQVSFVTALAVHDTVAAFCGADAARLKWPNDCLLKGAKVSGILCETAEGGQVVIGTGINVAHSPDGLPYRTAHLGSFAPSADVAAVFEVYSRALTERLALWREGVGFATIMAAWNERAHGLHQPVQVVQGTRNIQGRFSGLGSDGALIVTTADGGQETIYAGDVTFTTADP